MLCQWYRGRLVVDGVIVCGGDHGVCVMSWTRGARYLGSYSCSVVNELNVSIEREKKIPGA
jgi:hypothetical protein